MTMGAYVKSIAVLSVGLLALLVPSSTLLAQTAPWDVNVPIVSVDKQLYESHYTDPSNGKNYAPWIFEYRTGPELHREERKAWIGQSDTPIDPTHRFYLYNDQTETWAWTAWEVLPPAVTYDGDVRIYSGPFACTHDPTSGKAISLWLRQAVVNPNFGANHCFIRTSDDYGQTWGNPQLLKYEDGPDFDPDDPYNVEFMTHNYAYPGTNFELRADGSLLLGLSSVKIPDDVPLDEYDPYGIADPAAIGIGGINFVLDWDSQAGEYTQMASNVAWVPRHVSSRGLIEPTVAELTDGRLLTVYRCSNDGIAMYGQNGRKRYSISTDGGETISQPLELKYDDGSRFYSPSALSQLIRHSVSGKLYWVGNINMAPAEGNHYRHPLVIAEVDEVNVALKKNTVTLIDTKDADDGDYMQLSNFSLLENRQTHDFEIHATRLGEDPNDTWKADGYKYTLTLVPQKPPDTDPTPVAAGGTIPYAWYRTDVENVPTAVVTYYDGTGKVAWLQDQTGSRHLAAIGDPHLTDNGVDGRSVVTFEGHDDYLLGTEAEWGEAAPGTVFVVYQRTGTSAFGKAFLYDSTTEQRQFFSVRDDYTPNRLEIGGTVFEDGISQTHFTGGGVLPDPVGTDQWAVASVSHVTGSTDTIRINGQEVYVGNLLSGGMTGLRLGSYYANQDRNWTGDIGEFIVFEGALTPEEVATIELILMVRWGMVTMVPGDTNNDDVVDQQDAEKLAANWGTNVTGGAPEGDFNGDGLVGLADAAILAAHWHYGVSEAAGVVPEPSTLTLLLTAALAGLLGRRRR